MTLRTADSLCVDILKALGIDHTNAARIGLDIVAGEVPVLTVEFVVFGERGAEVVNVLKKWEVKEKGDTK